MKNLISRASAIDIVRFECGEWEGLAKTIIKRFEQLPSAQPELAQNLHNACTDLISRQAAIDALENTKEVAR